MTTQATSVERAPNSQRAPSSQRAPRQDVLARLKLETAREHAAIEAATGVMKPDLTLDEYREYLEKTWGFYAPAEEILRRLGVWQVLGVPAEERMKLLILERDLAILGQGQPAHDVVVCAAPPRLAGVAEGIGCAYVLEGSTLGGRVISRHIRERFGEESARGFLECYGAKTGENWHAFRAAVLRFAHSPDAENRIIAGAKETFRSFTRWLA